MNIALRKLFVNDRMSDETTCFSAEVYVDGSRVASVMNRGQGGDNETHLFGSYSDGELRAKNQRLLTAADEYLKTLPGVTAFGIFLPMDLDLWIGIEVEKMTTIKSFSTKAKSKTLVYETPEDKAAGRYTEYDEQFSQPLKSDIIAAHPNAEIINESILGASPAPQRFPSNRLLRVMKTAIVYSPDGSEKLLQHKAPYSDRLAAQIRERYPQAEILNEKYGIVPQRQLKIGA